ncbi:hypothetical protein MSPP1_002762 [Malassezia sp. CBS 17886]|nr:hypothetical protein MSPP1_002762 [Malassezia sp. CBS 17886]
MRSNFPPALSIAPGAPGVRDAGAFNFLCDSAEDIAEFGIAGRIWESAFLLLRYVEGGDLIFDPPCTLVPEPASPPVCIVELGAGVGTAGLGVARAMMRRNGLRQTPDTLILTDLREFCPLLERNAREMTHPATAPAARAVHVHVRALRWGDGEAAHAVRTEVAREDKHVTHVLCSDLVYFLELLAPLLRTLLDMTAPQSGCTPEVVIGYKIRSLTKEEPFWAAFGSWFEFDVVQCAPRAALHPRWTPFGSSAAHLAGPERVDDDYFVFVARRKRSTWDAHAPRSDARLLAGDRVVAWDDGAEVFDADASGAAAFEWMLLCRSAGAGEGEWA